MKLTEEKRREILNSVGNFCWDFGCTWFVETSIGNFIWSDPDYNGDNSFKQIEETFQQFNHPAQLWRDKGYHHIERYCGDAIDIILLDP